MKIVCFHHTSEELEGKALEIKEGQAMAFKQCPKCYASAVRFGKQGAVNKIKEFFYRLINGSIDLDDITKDEE